VVDLDGAAVLFSNQRNIVEFGFNKLLKEIGGQRVNVGVELSISIARMSRRESLLILKFPMLWQGRC